MTLNLLQNEEAFTSAQNLQAYQFNNFSLVTFIILEDYNSMENKSEHLSSNEALLYTFRGNIPGETLDFNGYKFSIKKRISSLETEGIMSSLISNTYYVVVDNVDTIQEVFKALKGTDKTMEGLSYYYGFNLEADRDTQIKLTFSIQYALKALNLDFSMEGREVEREASLLFTESFSSLAYS